MGGPRSRSLSCHQWVLAFARYHPAIHRRMTSPGSARGQTVLRANQLTKVFGPRPERALALLDEGCDNHEILARTHCSVAVQGVSFDIFSGELFVIMGLSGSGKSTVIRLLNRLIEPTRGSVELDGREIHGLGRRELREVRNRRLSMVFQHFAIFPHRSVREKRLRWAACAASQHSRAT